MAATCRVPPSNLASQSLTGLALAVARRRMRVTLAPLGHDQAEAMITDESSFEYYDAILTRLMPVGGPRLGSTEVRLAGSFNPNPNPDPNPNPTPTPNPNPEQVFLVGSFNPNPNPNPNSSSHPHPHPTPTPTPTPNPTPTPEQIFLVGSGFGSCVGSEFCYAPVKALRLADQRTTVWDRPLCIFRRAPPLGGGGFDPSAQVIGTSVAAVETANLVVCTTPSGPGAFAFKQTGNPTTFELTVDIALNGLVSESPLTLTLTLTPTLTPTPTPTLTR